MRILYYVMVQVACLCLHITSRNHVKHDQQKVAELALYRDRLPEKLRYLADAPKKTLRVMKPLSGFSRKEKHQYVTSEKNGKATKWIVDYIDGKWVERKK